jgi:NAD+ kinase
MRFGISGNTDKIELPHVVERLVKRFKKDDVPYVIPISLAEGLKGKLDKRLLQKTKIVSDKTLHKECDILISLGGDGTILRMARLLSEYSTPILGINLGKLGFLAEVSVEELDMCLDEILKGEYKIEERMMLEAQVGKSKKIMYALNDIVLDQTGSSRMFNVQTFVNKDLLSKFMGDGIIVATPTGSSAYVLSNGGPIVTPTNRSILISPICPHTLTARTVVVPDESIVTLKVETASGKIHLAADGQPQAFFKPPVEIIIKRSDLRTKLVKRLNTSYYDVLRRKLHWGRDVRNA